MFDNDVLVIQHTLSSCNKCIFIHWMNTLIITEAELIIKGDATVQLRISAVLLRKPGRWDAPYAHSAGRKIRQREELISIIKKQLSDHRFFLRLAAVLIKVRLFLAQLRSQPGAAQDFSNMLFRFMD